MYARKRAVQTDIQKSRTDRQTDRQTNRAYKWLHVPPFNLTVNVGFNLTVNVGNDKLSLFDAFLHKILYKRKSCLECLPKEYNFDVVDMISDIERRMLVMILSLK